MSIGLSPPNTPSRLHAHSATPMGATRPMPTPNALAADTSGRIDFSRAPSTGPTCGTALRYVERNPVRASLVDRASAFPWSSASAHIGVSSAPDWLEPEPMRSTFTPEQWAIYLTADTFGAAEVEVRQNTYTGRPAGSRDFVEWAEYSLGRKLTPQSGGRPAKITGSPSRRASGASSA